jgi:hypothetical protein
LKASLHQNISGASHAAKEGSSLKDLEVKYLRVKETDFALCGKATAIVFFRRAKTEGMRPMTGEP